MNFVNLVKLIVAREEWEEREHFKKNASHSPIVHLVIIISISEETLRRAIPPS